MQEIWVQSLGQEDALEKEMTTHTSILAWEIPWPEEPGGLQSMGSQIVNHWACIHTHTHTHTHAHARTCSKQGYTWIEMESKRNFDSWKTKKGKRLHCAD